MDKTEKSDGLYKRLIDIGLRDPFIGSIAAGAVLMAVVGAYVVKTTGSGMNAAVTLGAFLLFGVLLIVVRSLFNDQGSPVVRMIGSAFAVVVTLVFLTFVVLLVPATTACWPQDFAQLLRLSNCAPTTGVEKVSTAVVEKEFSPVPLQNVSYSQENAKYLVLVFYRLERFDDAEHIVGALRSAGYNSDGIQDNLDEVVAPDKRPDTSLIKTTALARPIVDEVSNLVRAAIPMKAPYVSVFPDDAPLQRGNIQISLF